MDNIYKLQQRAEELRKRMQTDSISPDDTFGLQSDVIQYVAELERNLDGLGIRRIYKNVEEMEADSAAPTSSIGKALRLGQLVCVFDKDNQTMPDNGDIYSWQGGNTAWQKIGNISNIYPMQEMLDKAVNNVNSSLNDVKLIAEGLYRNVDISEIDSLWINNKQSLDEVFGTDAKRIGYTVYNGTQKKRVGYLYLMLDLTATFCNQVLITNQHFDEDTQELDMNLAKLGGLSVITRWRKTDGSTGWSKWEWINSSLAEGVKGLKKRIDNLESGIVERLKELAGSGNIQITADNSGTWYYLE